MPISVADRQQMVNDYAASRRPVYDEARPMLRNILAMGSDGHSVSDTGEAMNFLISQLTFTEAKVFSRLYTPMQGMRMVPIDTSAGEAVDSIRFEVYDWVGQGKRLTERAQDVPLVDVAYADVTFPVYNGGVGYEFTQEELRRTAFLRRPIDEAKMAVAIEAFQRHINNVALNGESPLTGLFNSTIVPHGNAPTGNWASATPTQILGDINNLIQTVWTQTNFNDMITDILLPPTSFSTISYLPRADVSDTTVLQFIKQNNIGKTQAGIDINFTPGYGLDTAGVGGTKRMIGYVKSDTRLIMHMPMPLRFLAPQLWGYAVKVPGEYKYSGVQFRYPNSAYYMDGL